MIDALIDVDKDIDYEDLDEFVDDIDANLKEDEFDFEPCVSENVSEELDENLEEGEWLPPKDFAEKDWDEIIFKDKFEHMVVETVMSMQSEKSFVNPEL